MTKFSSLDVAISAGFVAASERQYLEYRGCSIRGFDISGLGRKGLAWALRVEVPEDLTTNYLGVLSDRSFGVSVEVQIVGWGGVDSGAGSSGKGASGRGIQMFVPQVFEQALRDAQQWTDKWFGAHPEAVSRMNERALSERSGKSQVA